MKVWKDRKQLEILFPPNYFFLLHFCGKKLIITFNHSRNPHVFFFRCSSPPFFGGGTGGCLGGDREVDFRWPLEAGSTVSRTPEELLTELRQVLITKAGSRGLKKRRRWKVHCLGWCHMGVSKNNGTPKSSILIGFSIINHPFWGTPIFGNIHIMTPGELQIFCFHISWNPHFWNPI